MDWFSRRYSVGSDSCLDFRCEGVPKVDMAFAAMELYEQQYHGRGDMGKGIKEQRLCLFTDGTSCRTLRANHLRPAFSKVA
jgi:Transposase DDE domain group 1